ncbi:MAG: DUF6677 family protein [Phycisphaerales bacterium]
MTNPTHPPERAEPLAGALAFLLPGLGHLVLAQPRRAVLIFLGVIGLFTSGLLIGGIDVVDRRDDKWWFLGQALTGPVAFAVDHLHQSLKEPDPRTGRLLPPSPSAPGEKPPPYSVSIAKPNEIGALFCTLAGLLNLIAIIDASWHAPRPRPEPRHA